MQDDLPNILRGDLDRSARADETIQYTVHLNWRTAPADRSKAFLVPVNGKTRIISDDLQWIVQTQKGKANFKSSGWRSRHFSRSREGLQLALRRLLGPKGVPADVVAFISTLPEWHHIWLQHFSNMTKEISEDWQAMA